MSSFIYHVDNHTLYNWTNSGANLSSKMHEQMKQIKSSNSTSRKTNFALLAHAIVTNDLGNNQQVVSTVRILFSYQQIRAEIADILLPSILPFEDFTVDRVYLSNVLSLPSSGPLSISFVEMTHLPKHLLWLVARSMKTFEDMTLPKGTNICMSSVSPNSCGRW